MRDIEIEAIHDVDPCPTELPPPPIALLQRRLLQEPAPAGPHVPHRQPSFGTFVIAISSAGAVAIALAALVLLRHGNGAGSPVVRAGSAGETRACRPRIINGVLPSWARDGFTQPRPRMRYALGRSGRIAAILWVTLESPPAANRNNKILWVSRDPIRYGQTLTIHAQRMDGTRRRGVPVIRIVTGGPGPSIINLPVPGCWRFTLTWSGWTDQLDLQYERPA